MDTIIADNLVKAYAGRVVLRRIGFRVAAGELLALLGPNGAGKTTTIRIFAGLTRADGGRARVAGTDVAEPGARRLIGLAPQTINLDMELTLTQNLDIQGRLFGLSGARRRERIGELVERFRMHAWAHERVARLSGGQRRRGLIARALMHRPEALFLDEPTAGLDPDIRRSLWALVKELQARGTAIVLTTHYIEEAEALADRVAFLREGAIIRLERPETLAREQGEWAAVDAAGRSATRFFSTREQALACAAASGESVTVRRSNLEDAYLTATGHADATPGEGLSGPVREARHGRGHGSGHGMGHGGHG